MQRLNVRQSQIKECIEKSLFAVDIRPNYPKGEILLLQLVKHEAILLGKLHSRIGNSDAFILASQDAERL